MPGSKFLVSVPEKTRGLVVRPSRGNHGVNRAKASGPQTAHGSIGPTLPGPVLARIKADAQFFGADPLPQRRKAADREGCG